MDSSIKPKPMIGEILPGFTFLVLFLFCYFRAHPCQFEWILSMGGGVTIATSGLVLIVSWIIGDIFDAIRDTLGEGIFDLLQPLWWDFFFKGDSDKVNLLEEYYFSYYKLDCNFVIGIALFLLSEWLFCKFDLTFISPLPWYANVIILPVVAIVFFSDAMVLRHAMKKLLDEEKAKKN